MIPCFRDPFPDEIFYSVCARYKDRVQYPDTKDIFQELFGTGYAFVTVDLPCRLQHFFDRLPMGHTYTIDFFIDHHTLLPFYAPFLPEERYQHIKEQMILGTGQALHRRLGTGLNSSFSSNWLRYCPACVEEDRKVFGEPYWHRLHQTPGVEVCFVHETFLENSTIQMRSTFAKKLVSAKHAIQTTVPRTATSSPFYTVLMKIAQDISYLLEHPRAPMDKLFFRAQYQKLLIRQGLMTLGGNIRTYDLLKAFINDFPPELLILLHCEMKQKRQNKNWLSGILNSSTTSHHPLKHILAIEFLGSNVRTFFSQNFASSKPFGNGPWPCLNPICKHYQQKRILIYRLSEHRGKGCLVGIFACDCGFMYSRCGPDHSYEDIFRKDATISYGRVWETELRKLWFDLTLTCNDIAQRLEVNESTVRKQAARLQLPVPRHPDRRWKRGEQRKVATKDTEWYRAQWLTLLNEMPEATVSTLLKRSRNVWYWLQKNDREWYTSHLPPRKSRRKPKVHVYVDSEHLEKRPSSRTAEGYDYHIAEIIRKVAQNLINNPGPPRRITVAEISRHVPQIRRLRYKPNKASLAVQALNEVIETREAFAIRRLKWAVRQYQEEQILPTRGNLIQRAHLRPILSSPAVKQALDEAIDSLQRFG